MDLESRLGALLLLIAIAGCSRSGAPPEPGAGGGDLAGASGAGDHADLAGADFAGADFAGGGGADLAGGGQPDLLHAPMTPVTINFDDLKAAAVVTNQYAVHATFSAQSGYKNEVLGGGNLGQSKPNFICTCNQNSGNGDTYVDFTAPVEQLTFRGLCMNAHGKAAQVNVFSGGVMVAMQDIIGTGDCTKGQTIDLTQYHQVSRIEIVAITDPQGIGWDDFAFVFPGP